MSSVKTWLTNEELMRGLSDGYVLYGNAPPPVRFEAEDDEMQEMFGEEISEAKKSIECKNQPPDLRGITDLLRMVQGPEDENNDENLSNNIQQSNCVVVIHKPSNLNPNVKEFIPRSLASPSSSNVSESKAGVEKTGHRESETNCVAEEQTKEDKVVGDNKPNVYDDPYLKKLKNEIIEASKSDSFEIKKQKNVAIATLLQFYASNSNMKSPKKTAPVKLLTPDFFECSKSSKTDIDRPSTSTSSDKVVSDSPVTLDPVCTQDIKENTMKNSKNNVDTEIKKSIEKVNQWLSSPVEKKTSPLCLGPIAFKRKESSTSKSPSICETDPKKASNSTQPSQYQPSNYAADLGKKYMARNKIKESKRNTWTDLDLILKERDHLIRKRQEQANENSNSEEAH